jgi:hypothetical protein
MRLRTEQGDNLVDLIDSMTLHPDVRRQIVRLLGELEALR